MSIAFLLTSLIWTGLLALIAQTLTYGRVSPYFAQSVWRFAGLFMVLPWAVLALSPLFPAPQITLPNLPDLIPIDTEQDVPPILKTSSSQPVTASVDISNFLAGLLVFGWVVQTLQYISAHIRLYALKHNANSQDKPELSSVSTKWATHLRLSKPPRIAILANNRSPFVSGFGQPVIYLPKDVDDKIHLDHIIAHECNHIARGDLFTRPLERLVASLIWFSPFTWFARAKLDYYREAVCDAQTIKLTQDPVAYSRALTHVARTTRPVSPLPISALIPSRRRNLPMRISSILEPSVKISRKRLTFGLTSLLIITPFALAQGLKDTASRTQTFSAPVLNIEAARVTSPYGLRADPFTKRTAWHSGVDIGGGKTPANTPIPIYTPAAGEVIFADNSSGYGNRVDVRLSSSGHVVRFGHLAKFSVKLGENISAGTEVGTMGGTNRSTGRHTHLEYLIDGEPYNPVEIKGLTLISAVE